MKLEFVSYPKSGRSWLRYALTQLEIADPIAFHHDGFEFFQGSKPAHNFSLDDRLARYQNGSRIVYLTRDPRDILVSLYFQITGRFGPVFKYQGNISDFIRDDYFGAENLLKFRQIWEILCARNIATKVTYEQCHEDFASVLGHITRHFGFTVSQNQLLQAADAASFENMKKVELSETFPKNWLRPKHGASKVRRGCVGGYRDYLTDADVTYLNNLFVI